MDQERKAQWVAALRSGEYKQGAGRLHRVINGEELFCCLGVACDLAWRDGAVDREPSTGGVYMAFRYEGMDCYPPVEVRERFDTDEVRINVFEYEDSAGNQYAERLDELNDEVGLTFSQIADLIERWM